jgi:hypothetical protein
MLTIAVLQAIVLAFWAVGLVAVLYGAIRGRFDPLTGLLALAAVVFIPVLGSALVTVLVVKDRRVVRAGRR